MINAEIILSLKPKYCRLIFNGEKDIEIRKTIPHKGLPFRVFVYETKEGVGAVTGEFIVNRFWCNYQNYNDGYSCLTDKELFNYGKGKAYGWHIVDAVKYDKPIDLKTFGFDRAPQSWCYTKEEAQNEQ
jgi:predicted transcriptional regulator